MPLRRLTAITSTGLIFSTLAYAGPYSGASDTTGYTDAGVSSASPEFAGWATHVVDFHITASGSGDPANALGAYNTSLVSLGDLTAQQITDGDAPGSITLGFDGFRDGDGWDFAVFENGFLLSGGLFAELAYVEVSSNGVDFARFDSVSLNTGPIDPGFGPGFQGFDMTNVYNLAGKHASGLGTPFDLAELSDHALAIAGTLDLEKITHVRLVDIPGNGVFLDSVGNGILDNWPTSGTGGFDLRAIGFAHAVPEPSIYALMLGLGAMAFILQRKTR